MNTIAVTASGFALSGPLVAGEPVAVSVSGVEFADGARPCLTIRARFPNALLASADLAWDANAGAWKGTLYTATKQTVIAFLTARADEARPVALELLDAEHSESVARISVSMLNSSLLPTDNPPDAQGPEYLGVPGEKGDKGDEGGGALKIGTPQSVSTASASVAFRAGEIVSVYVDAGEDAPTVDVSGAPVWTEGEVGTARRAVLVLQNQRQTALKVVGAGGAYTMLIGKPAVCEAWVTHDMEMHNGLTITRIAPVA